MHRQSISSTTAARTSPPRGAGRLQRLEITFSTAARQAGIVFAITLFVGLCGWSPSLAQQVDGNWMREYVQARVLERNLRAVGAQTGRMSGTELRSLLRPRIVGGTEAGAADNPFQVALLQRNIANNRSAQFCGGTLVRENVVVTAAHCSDGPITANVVQVLTGTRRLDVPETVGMFRG
jgi:Trypsin